MMKKFGYLMLTGLMAMALISGNGFAAPAETPMEEPEITAPDKKQGETHKKKMRSGEKKKKKMKMAAKKKSKKHADAETDAPSDAPKPETN